MPSLRNSSEGPTHSGSVECDSRQAFQTQPADPDRVVPLSARVQSLVLEMGQASSGPLCNPVQPQTSQVCISSAGSDSLGSQCNESVMGESGCIRFSSSLSTQPNDLQGNGSGLSQNDSNRSRVAEHALVLGPSQPVSSDSTQASASKRSGDTAIQRPCSQESQQSESTCLAPRASAIQGQGFSDEVATRIEASQRQSTRAVYKSKWVIFVKWCGSDQVDFRSPSVNKLRNFFYTFSKREICNLAPLKVIEQPLRT